MSKPQIAIASLGGTITMVAVDSGSAVVPKLNIADLLATAPGLAQVATLKTETLSTVPGASLDFRNVLDAFTWSRDAVRDGADGIVLIQGTDTIEETAYLLDLHWDRPEPIVVTGAMRSPAIPGTDGPANILAAVQVAADPRSRGLGALVVMNDEVHSAARVRKIRASGVNAFSSPSFGPVAYVEEGSVVFGNRPSRWPALDLAPADSYSRVALVEVSLGDDGTLLDLAGAGHFGGIVLAGFGVGHVSPALAHSLSRAIAACPVVLASRTGAGTTYGSTYGFIGSESDLLARGAISAGWLDPRKARILLSCLIALGSDRTAIGTEFGLRGGSPAGPVVTEPSQESR